MPTLRIPVHRLVAGRIEHVEHSSPGQRPRCTQLSGCGWPCLTRPHWALAWVLNPSGMPGLGEAQADFVCDVHLAARVRAIAEFTEADTPVTVIPYQPEEP